MGGLIAWLAGCAPRRQRIDTEAVQAELQAAADGCAGYVKGLFPVRGDGERRVAGVERLVALL